MFAFFDTLIEYIKMIFGFFVSFINSLIALGQVLVASVTLPQQLILWAPTFLSTSITIVVAVSIIKLLLGRNNG